MIRIPLIPMNNPPLPVLIPIHFRYKHPLQSIVFILAINTQLVQVAGDMDRGVEGGVGIGEAGFELGFDAVVVVSG